MKKAFALFSALFLCLVANAENSSWYAPLANKSLLLDIEIINENKIVAVGEYGHILLSNDGDKWRQANVPSQTTLTSVFFLNKHDGWAVGHDATILHSSDGGENWQVKQYLTSLEIPLFDIAFKDRQNGIAIGAYGLFFRTVDGGETWQQEFHEEFLHPDDISYLNELKLDDEEAYLDEISGILPHFNRLEIDGRTLYLVGEVGLIAKSNDFGRTWIKLDEIYHGSFFDLARTQEGNLLVCGLRGNIFKSKSNGTPWHAITTETTALLNSIVLNDQQQIFILGNNGVLLVSDDDGASFHQSPQSDGRSLIDGVWFKNRLIVVSDLGVKTIELLR
ncbi:MAG: WD40/YVTN/BNR-like repeat-containing protein [Thalassotalea sp.]